MRYTEDELDAMSFSEWMETIANELNKAGFKRRGFNSELDRWQDNYAPYRVSDPKFFLLGELSDPKALDYAKSIGLINNGRCPMCGKKIYGDPGRFTSRFDTNFHFQICQDCAGSHGRSSRTPDNNKGCMLALLLFPWYAVKGFLSYITTLM